MNGNKKKHIAPPPPTATHISLPNGKWLRPSRLYVWGCVDTLALQYDCVTQSKDFQVTAALMNTVNSGYLARH